MEPRERVAPQLHFPAKETIVLPNQMVGESFHQSGCRGEDDDHIRLGAMVPKLSRLFVLNRSAIRVIRGDILPICSKAR